VNRSAAALAVVCWQAAALGAAQDARFEMGAVVGWTSSDGVSGAAATVPGLGVFNGLEPGDSFSWGLWAGYRVSDALSLEFQFGRQESQLSAFGTASIVLGDMAVENYHGVLAYHFGAPAARVRPFVLGGLGVTRYTQLTFSAADQPRRIGGDTRFSTTWGAGVKLWPGRAVGLRLQARWTPTHIKADTSGWWCDPYWGCYVLSEAQYANQFELAAGLSLRF
jgi:opacity protein-like surface antigen